MAQIARDICVDLSLGKDVLEDPQLRSQPRTCHNVTQIFTPDLSQLNPDLSHNLSRICYNSTCHLRLLVYLTGIDAAVLSPTLEARKEAGPPEDRDRDVYFIWCIDNGDKIIPRV